ILQEGDVAFAALGWAEYPLPETYEEASDRLERTAHYWQDWLKHGSFPDHPWRTYLQRSALTLKGLTYAPTGAMVAAPTTSLPEAPGGERNWDYRYSWIRDSTFMLWALYTLGFDWEANDFFYFVADVSEAEERRLQIMYGIGAERTLTEQTLDHLSGYGGALAGRGGRDPRRHLHERRRQPGRLHPALRDRRAGRLGPSAAAGALPARERSPRARHRAGDRRRAD